MENNKRRRYAQEKSAVGNRRLACENESSITEEIIGEIIRTDSRDSVRMRMKEFLRNHSKKDKT